MTTKSMNEHIEITPGVARGKPRLAGHRITVHDVVVWHEWLGRSAEEIAHGHNLPLAGIYAALAYYHDHKPEIDTSLKESEAFVEAMRRKIPSKLPKS